MTKYADWEKTIRFGVIHYYGQHELDFEKASLIAQKNPNELGASNVWTAAALGDVISLGQHLDSDASLAQKVGGPFDWAPILYLCHSRIKTSSQDWKASLQLLIDQGADPNSHYMVGDTYKFTCLTGVMGEGEAGTKLWPPHPQAMEVAEVLLKNKADPNDGQGLYNTMFSGGIHWLELLVKFGLNQDHVINWTTDRKMSIFEYLLTYACRKNQIDRAEFLLNQGANPMATDWYVDMTAMRLAVSCGNQEMVELLLAAGASPEPAADAKEEFFDAVVALDKEKASTLLSGLPEDILQKWKDESAPVMANQVELNRISVVSYLMELGFPVGRSLFEAAWNGHFAMAKMLVENGASVRVRDKHHLVTPIAFANRTGYTDLRDYLLEQDADIFDVISFGSVERLEELVIADPGSIERKFSDYVEECPDLDDITPLTHAVMLGKVDQVDLLMQLGADPKVLHPDGRNLAQIATDFIESQN